MKICHAYIMPKFADFSEMSDDADCSGDGGDMSYRVTQVYWPFIKSMVKFNHIVPLMKDIMRDKQRQILNAEREGDTDKAAQIFLECLTQSEEEGKYQTFLDALNRKGYKFLIDVLNEKISNADHAEQKQVIDLYIDNYGHVIDPTEIAQDCLTEEIILPEDEEKIRNFQRNENSKYASCILLDAIPRRRSDWYRKFLKILYKREHFQLVKLIDEKVFDNLQKESSGENYEGDINFESQTHTPSHVIPRDADENEPSIESSSPNTLNLEFHENPGPETSSALPERVAQLSEEVKNISRLEGKIDNLTHQVEVMNRNFEKLLAKLEQK